MGRRESQLPAFPFSPFPLFPFYTVLFVGCLLLASQSACSRRVATPRRPVPSLREIRPLRGASRASAAQRDRRPGAGPAVGRAPNSRCDSNTSRASRSASRGLASRWATSSSAISASRCPGWTAPARVLEQIYTLEPTRTGKLAVFPIVVTFVDKRPTGDGREHKLETEGLTVEIASVAATEVPSLGSLRPAAGPGRVARRAIGLCLVGRGGRRSRPWGCLPPGE